MYFSKTFPKLRVKSDKISAMLTKKFNCIHLDLELNFSLRFACCSLEKTSLGPVVRATLNVQTNLGSSNPPMTAEMEGRSSGTSQCV